MLDYHFTCGEARNGAKSEAGIELSALRDGTTVNVALPCPRGVLT